LNDNQFLNDNSDYDCIFAYIVQSGAISTTIAAQIIWCSHSTAHSILLQLITETGCLKTSRNYEQKLKT